MKKNRGFIILLMLFFCVTQLLAQSPRTVKGTVMDESGKPLARAIISGDEGDIFTTADKSGFFSIDIIFSDVLLVEKEGYISKRVSAANLLNTDGKITLSQPAYMMGENDQLQLPFHKLAHKRSTGSVTRIDAKQVQSYDSRQGLNAILDGLIPGSYGVSLWGRGNAVIVVDGIPKTENTDISMREIESITVLKDPVTRSMYGAIGDQGVIMVNTKRGKAFSKVLNLQSEFGVSTPLKHTLPKYMNAADYMQTYNTIYPGTYSESKINDTKDGVNPALNPDMDFYSSEMIRSTTQFFNLYGESSGGNKQAQYYLNLDWQRNNGWMKLGDQYIRDNIKIRGNVDYQLTESFKMKLDANVMFNMEKSPNITDYWEQASTVYPNSYPFYWDPALIVDPAKRAEVTRDAVLANGMLLGGNTIYNRNIYGDLTRNGNRSVSERNMQVNVGAEWDLKSLLPGLKANGNIAFDAFNTLVKAQSSTYAVYNPQFSGNEVHDVEVIGKDVLASNYAVKNTDMTFYRRISMFGNLTYDQRFGNTDLSLVAVAYRDQLALNKGKQEQRNLTFGLSGNLMHNNKYLVDFSLGLLGSQKLSMQNRYTFTPTVGLGWVITEEKFMKRFKVIDYLKFRASAGVLKNDNWENYFLYTAAYSQGNDFNYNNGQNKNSELSYISRANNIDWQKRREFTVGLDASLFDNRLWLEGAFFHTQHYDQITEMKNTYPMILGTKEMNFWDNYNANRINGFEFGIRYLTKFTKNISLTIGSNLVVSKRTLTKVEELSYTNAYQYKEGKAANSIWGLKSDGLYSVDDFDELGNLLSTLPVPTWGTVVPGDIKYIDKSGDNKINSEDVHVLGKNSGDFQYSLYFNLKIKGFELYVLGMGVVGNNNMRNGDYFRTYGDLKFPEHLKHAYSTENPNINAAYPRLTATKSDHNFQNSDFWMYRNNWFNIPVIQLTYNIQGGAKSIIKNAKVYLRGTDVIKINKYSKYTDLSAKGVPKTQSYVVGCMLAF